MVCVCVCVFLERGGGGCFFTVLLEGIYIKLHCCFLTSFSIENARKKHIFFSLFVCINCCTIYIICMYVCALHRLYIVACSIILCSFTCTK